MCTDIVDKSCAIDVAYNACLIGMSLQSHTIILLTSTGINRDIITATAVIAGISSLAFGFFTNLPVALA
jgi:AGZA family xanthine/uracil permease-like MFS transporter